MRYKTKIYPLTAVFVRFFFVGSDTQNALLSGWQHVFVFSEKARGKIASLSPFSCGAAWRQLRSEQYTV